MESTYSFWGNNFLESKFDKIHHDFRQICLIGWHDLTYDYTEKHIIPFYKNPEGKFVEFDLFNFLDNFTEGYYSWILIIMKMENNSPRTKIHQYIRRIAESTQKKISPWFYKHLLDTQKWRFFLEFQKAF